MFFMSQLYLIFLIFKKRNTSTLKSYKLQQSGNGADTMQLLISGNIQPWKSIFNIELFLWYSLNMYQGNIS